MRLFLHLHALLLPVGPMIPACGADARSEDLHRPRQPARRARQAHRRPRATSRQGAYGGAAADATPASNTRASIPPRSSPTQTTRTAACSRSTHAAMGARVAPALAHPRRRRPKPDDRRLRGCPRPSSAPRSCSPPTATPPSTNSSGPRWTSASARPKRKPLPSGLTSASSMTSSALSASIARRSSPAPSLAASRTATASTRSRVRLRRRSSKPLPTPRSSPSSPADGILLWQPLEGLCARAHAGHQRQRASSTTPRASYDPATLHQLRHRARSPPRAVELDVASSTKAMTDPPGSHGADGRPMSLRAVRALGPRDAEVSDRPRPACPAAQASSMSPPPLPAQAAALRQKMQGGELRPMA